MWDESLAKSSPLFHWARTAPDAVMFYDESPVSASSLYDQVQRYRRILQNHGVDFGDRAILLAGPSREYYCLLWALFLNGSLACPVNPLMPETVLKRIFPLLQPRCILGDAASGETRAALSVNSLDFSSIAQEVSSSDAANCPDCSNPDIPATVVLSSGTTGMPKVAVHTMANHLAAAAAANANMPLQEGDVWLLSLPLYHVSGLAVLFRCALTGATVALPRPGAPLHDELARTRATHVSLVPTQLQRLLSTGAGIKTLQGMKGILMGGAPMARALVQDACARHAPIVRSYGMTETSAQICATPPGASPEELLSDGRPLRPDTVRVKEMQIEVRGPSLFQGYLSREEKIERPETPDGWFRTGDLGMLDDRGWLYVTGRADSMFISGGENIYPEEIEAALLELPEIERAAVVDMKDSEYGRVPAAFVEFNPGCRLDESQIRAKLLQILPRFKVPRRFFPWPAQLPPALKVDRGALRKELEKVLSAS